MRKSLFAAAALLSLTAAAPACAAQYMFEFSGTNLFGSPAMTSGNGVFTTSDTATTIGGQTAYGITSITGTVNGSDIVVPTGSYGAYFTTGPSFLDGTGTTFMTQAGTTVVFFFQDNLATYRVNTFTPGATGFVTAASSAVAAVPEPATWAMLLIGFFGLGALLRQNRKSVLVTA